MPEEGNNIKMTGFHVKKKPLYVHRHLVSRGKDRLKYLKSSRGIILK